MAADSRSSNPIRTWRRSSRCSPDGRCVDISRACDSTIVRDSKGDLTLQAFDEAQWSAFVRYCRRTR